MHKVIIIIIAGFEKVFYVVRHLDSTATYLPTGLLLGDKVICIINNDEEE
jgi:hypothetical protein